MEEGTMTTYEDGARLVFGYIDYSIFIAIAEMELLIQSMSLSGAGPEAIRAFLVNDLSEGGRIFGTLANGITNSTAIGITSSAQIAEILEYAKEGVEEYKWVTVSKNPCPECRVRAGRTEDKEYWDLIGMPRSGFSRCRGNCKCHLEPSTYKGKDTIILE